MKSDRRLRSVPKADQPLVLADDIYAKGREKAEDRDHWARVHIEADRRNLSRGWLFWWG